MNLLKNLTLIEPPLTITPDALLAEGRKRVRRRRLRTLTASSLALVGGGALAVSLLSEGWPTPPRESATPAGAPASTPGPSGPSGKPTSAIDPPGQSLEERLAGTRKAMGPPITDPSPGKVLDAYLRALVKGDCTTAHKMEASSLAGNGAVCGQVTVKSYTAVGVPQTWGNGEAIFSTELLTEGGEPWLPARHLVFYTLVRQADGAWRLTGAGSGP
jgi:hypothetical protein